MSPGATNPSIKDDEWPSTFDMGPVGVELALELIRLRCGHNNEVSNAVFICCENIREYCEHSTLYSGRVRVHTNKKKKKKRRQKKDDSG